MPTQPQTQPTVEELQPSEEKQPQPQPEQPPQPQQPQKPQPQPTIEEPPEQVDVVVRPTLITEPLSPKLSHLLVASENSGFLEDVIGGPVNLDDIIPSVPDSKKSGSASRAPPANATPSAHPAKSGSMETHVAADSPWVVVRKFGKRGGVKIQVPDTLSELFQVAGEKLGIKGIAIREITSEARIDDIKALKQDDVIFLMSEEEEKNFD